MVVNGRISTVTRLPVQVDSMIGFLGSNHPLVFPVDVKLAALAKGAFAVCASSTKGVQCWGGNIEGTLGIGKASEQCKTPGSGNFDCNSKPVRVTGKWRSSRKPGSVSLMRTTVCALARSGKARCWGKGSTGMLGNGTTTMIQPTPVRVSEKSPFRAGECARSAEMESSPIVGGISRGTRQCIREREAQGKRPWSYLEDNDQWLRKELKSKAHEIACWT